MGQADWAQKREDLRFSVTFSVTAICGPTRCTGSFQKIPLTLTRQRKRPVAALLREGTGAPVTCGCCIRHRFRGQGRAGPGLTDAPAKPAGPLPFHGAVAPPVPAARGRGRPAPAPAEESSLGCLKLWLWEQVAWLEAAVRPLGHWFGRLRLPSPALVRSAACRERSLCQAPPAAGSSLQT